MSRRTAASIRWTFAALCGFAFLLVFALAVAFLLAVLDLNVQTLLYVEWLGVPAVVWGGLGIFAAGGWLGFRVGRQLRRRLEVLSEAIVKFERGHYGHRVNAGKPDEIGRIGLRLNEMAEQIERQVAALQKLSTEKAELLEQSNRTVVLEERQRIARELHDAVSQQLFAVSMMTAALLESEELGDGKLRGRIAVIDKLAETAQSEMRALLQQLRPPTLAGKSLKAALEQLFREFEERRGQIELRWEVAELPHLPKGVEDHLFRMVQEGLSNILRHSQATAVTVRLRVVGERTLHLRMMDNGVGFDAEAVGTASFGLNTMRERAHDIGAVVDIVSNPGQGTQIEVKVPIIGEERVERE
jgi:NarL family two-component system sensor histidine kinase LiaS